MRTITLITIALLLLNAQCFSQTSVSGTVVSKKGEPVTPIYIRPFNTMLLI